MRKWGIGRIIITVSAMSQPNMASAAIDESRFRTALQCRTATKHLKGEMTSISVPSVEDKDQWFQDRSWHISGIKIVDVPSDAPQNFGEDSLHAHFHSGCIDYPQDYTMRWSNYESLWGT